MSMRDLPRFEVSSRPGVRSYVSPQALERWTGDVRAADVEGTHTISIMDTIGDDWTGEGVTSKRVASALRAIGDNPVTVNIDSPGGNFFEGAAIYNLLRMHPQKVTVNIVGMAASAASIIAMAGDDIRIGRMGYVMIHNAWVVAAGNRHAMRDAADFLEPFDMDAVNVYATRSGQGAAEIAKMMDKETWIGGQSAVDQGFADGLLASDMLEVDPQASETRTIRAERKHDLICSRAGMTKSAGRNLLAELRGGKSGAAPTGTSGAADLDRQVSDLLDDIKSI